MKSKKTYIFIIIILLITVIIISKDKILFEYYFLYISSEEPAVREEYVEKIINMGDDVIPFLMERLYEPYIFEEKYIFICLEKITKIIYPPDILIDDLSRAKRVFWFNWYEEYQYE